GFYGVGNSRADPRPYARKAGGIGSRRRDVPRDASPGDQESAAGSRSDERFSRSQPRDHRYPNRQSSGSRQGGLHAPSHAPERIGLAQNVAIAQAVQIVSLTSDSENWPQIKTGW